MTPTQHVTVPRGGLASTLEALSRGSSPEEQRARLRELAHVDFEKAIASTKGRKLTSSRRTEYGGVLYASAAEAAFAEILDLEQLAGDVVSWTRQPRFDLTANGQPICRYTADFDVQRRAYREIVEVKGFPTELWRLRMQIFRATWLVEHPDVRFRVIWTDRTKRDRVSTHAQEVPA